MLDRGPLDRFHQAVGVGKVYGPYGPYPSSHTKQPYFTWIARADDGAIAATRLWPYLFTSKQRDILRHWPSLV